MKAYNKGCLGYRPGFPSAIYSYVIKVPPTWRDLYANGQKLLRQGFGAAEVAGRLGIMAERWLERSAQGPDQRTES